MLGSRAKSSFSVCRSRSIAHAHCQTTSEPPRLKNGSEPRLPLDRIQGERFARSNHGRAIGIESFRLHDPAGGLSRPFKRHHPFKPHIERRPFSRLILTREADLNFANRHISRARRPGEQRQ